jgi:hypothetical protein
VVSHGVEGTGRDVCWRLPFSLHVPWHHTILWLWEPLQNTATVGARCLYGMGVCPWHDLWAHHQTARRTGRHATKTGAHSIVVLPTSGAASAPAIFSMRSHSGKAIQIPHSRSPASRIVPSCSPPMLACLARRWPTPACCQPHAGMAAAGNRSAVTRWAAVADQRQSFMGNRLSWYLGQTQPRLSRSVSRSPPGASMSHTARCPPAPSALCRHRRHMAEAALCLGGLRACTAPAASRSASPQTGHSDGRQCLEQWRVSGTA